MKVSSLKFSVITLMLGFAISLGSAAFSTNPAKAETYQGSRGKKSSKAKEAETANDEPCGRYKDKQLYKGPKGGCYYINKNNNKTYVDRSECKC